MVFKTVLTVNMESGKCFHSSFVIYNALGTHRHTHKHMDINKRARQRKQQSQELMVRDAQNSIVQRVLVVSLTFPLFFSFTFVLKSLFFFIQFFVVAVGVVVFARILPYFFFYLSIDNSKLWCCSGAKKMSMCMCICAACRFFFRSFSFSLAWNQTQLFYCI